MSKKTKTDSSLAGRILGCVLAGCSIYFSVKSIRSSGKNIYCYVKGLNPNKRLADGKCRKKAKKK